MKRSVKRFTSLLLAILMMVSLLPTPTFAADVGDDEEPHAHVWDGGEVIEPASCDKDGVMVYTCECGETRKEAIPATGHAWGEWKVLKDAICTEDGEREHTCTVCGAVAAEVIPAAGHAWSEWVVLKDPTCTEDGEREHTCEVCKLTEQEAVPAPGHAWGEWVVLKDVTCTEDGEREHTCAACELTEQEVVPALGHAWGEWVTLQDATCTEDGEREHTCATCELTEQEVVPAMGHDWGEWTVTTEPTFFEVGEQERVCARCGETETEELPRLDTTDRLSWRFGNNGENLTVNLAGEFTREDSELFFRDLYEGENEALLEKLEKKLDRVVTDFRGLQLIDSESRLSAIVCEDEIVFAVSGKWLPEDDAILFAVVDQHGSVRSVESRKFVPADGSPVYYEFKAKAFSALLWAVDTGVPYETETEAAVSVIWADGDDADGLRPASLDVALLADGEIAGTVILDESNGWAVSLALPKYTAEYAPISYAWSAEATEGYELTAEGEGAAIAYTLTHEVVIPEPEPLDELTLTADDLTVTVKGSFTTDDLIYALRAADEEESFSLRAMLERELGDEEVVTDFGAYVLTDGEGVTAALEQAGMVFTVGGTALPGEGEILFAILTADGSLVLVDAEDAAFATDSFKVLLWAAVEPAPVELTYQELTGSVGDKTVTVAGMLPESAELSVVAVPLETAAAIYEAQTGETLPEGAVFCAFDVTILYNGEKYNPEDFDESVTVTVADVSTRETRLDEDTQVDVLHVKVDVTDGQGGLDQAVLDSLITEEADYEILPAETEGGEVFFDQGSCSLDIVILTREIPEGDTFVIETFYISVDPDTATPTSTNYPDPNNPGHNQTDYVWTPPEGNSNAGHEYKFALHFATSGQFSFYEPGQIQITIPRHIIVDRNGNTADLDLPGLSIPYYTAAGLTNENIFVYKFDSDGNIVIYNRLECSAASEGYIEVSYTTSKTTFNYTDYDPDGGSSYSDRHGFNFWADIVVTRGEESHSDHSEANVFLDTRARITSLVKGAPSKLWKTWQSSWGATPADADQYYYLLWPVTSYITANQPYTLDLSDHDFYSVTPEGVTFEVVGYRFGSSGAFGSNHTINLSQSYPNGRTDFVLTRHKISDVQDLNTYTLHNEATGTVTGRDDHIVSDASGARNWTYEKPTFKPGNGTYGMGKNGLDYRNAVVYDSEDIRNFDLEGFTTQPGTTRIPDIAYDVSSTVFAYPLTLATGGDKTDPDDYFENPVTYELYDNHLKLKYMGGDYGENYLTAADYEFGKVTFNWTINDAVFDEETQAFQTVTPNYADYPEDEIITVYAQYNGDESSWIPVAQYSLKNGAWITDSLNGVTVSGKTVIFPQGSNCTGWRITNTSQYHYKVVLSARPFVTLKRSDAVQEIVNQAYETEQRELALRNWATAKVYKGADTTAPLHWSGTDDGIDYIIGIVRHSSLSKSVTSKNDTVGRQAVLSWSINLNEYYFGHGGEKIYVAQSSGTFYDLLPKYATFDATSLAVFADNRRLSEGQYTYTLEDVEGAERQLLTVHITEPCNTQYTVSYKTNHPWDVLSTDIGKNAKNYVAYQTGNADIGDGYPDDGGTTGYHPGSHYNLPTGDGQGDNIRDLLTGLDPNNNGADRFVYTAKSQTITALTAGSLGLYKRVASSLSPAFTYDASVYTGENYSYRLYFATDPITQAKDLILLDNLEQYKPEGVTRDWNGTLIGFSMARANALNIAWKLYYSTTSGLNFETMGFADRDNPYNFAAHSDIWTATTDPYDPAFATATAFAIDLRYNPDGTDFILPVKTPLWVTVTMKAPDYDPSGNDISDPKVYNNIYLNSSVKQVEADEFEDPDLIHQDYTTVHLRQTGSAYLQKVDADEYPTIVPVEGIVFKLEGTSYYGTEISRTITTDADGYFSFINIESGEYTLEEIQGNEDYFFINQSIPLTIDKQGVGHLGDPIYDDEGHVTGYDTSPYGDIVLEIQEIPGTDPQQYLFLIGDEPRIHGDFEFVKTGSVDGSPVLVPLPGVSFYLHGESDYGTDVEKTADTLGDGVASFTDIEMGTYELEETGIELPEGSQDSYLVPPVTFVVVIDENGEASLYYKENENDDPQTPPEYDPSSPVSPLANGQYVVIQNGQYVVINEHTHGFDLWKYNVLAGSGNPNLAGAVFTLFGTSAYGNLISVEATSGDDGIASFTGLEPGDQYLLEETVAPPGFVRDTTAYPVVISTDGTVTINGKTVEEFMEDFTEKNGPLPEGFHAAPFPNLPVNTTITVVKEWAGFDEIPEDDLPIPTLHLDVEPPTPPTVPTATIDKDKWIANVSDGGINDHNVTNELRNATRFQRYPGSFASYDDAAAAGFVEIQDDALSAPYKVFYKLDGNTAYWWSDAAMVYFPADSSQLFRGAVSMQNLDLTGLYTEGVTNMASMFSQVGNQNDVVGNLGSCVITGLNHFDTSAVTNMSQMFNGSRFTAYDLSSFNTSNVTNMVYMFYRAGVADGSSTLILSSFNTAAVTDMSGMFEYCNFASIDLSSFNSQSVTKATAMFFQSENLTTLTLGEYFTLAGLTTNNSIASMFGKCSSLTSLDVSHFNTANWQTMAALFRNCTVLETITGLENWNTGNVKNFSAMFSYCESLRSLNLSTWNFSSVAAEIDNSTYHSEIGNIGLERMFNWCQNLTSLALPHGAQLTHAVQLYEMFNECRRLTSVDVSFLGAPDFSVAVGGKYPAEQSCGHVFYHCYSLATIYGYNWAYGDNTVNSSWQLFVGDNVLTGGSGTNYGSIGNTYRNYNRYAHIDGQEFNGLTQGYFTNPDSMSAGGGSGTPRPARFARGLTQPSGWLLDDDTAQDIHDVPDEAEKPETDPDLIPGVLNAPALRTLESNRSLNEDPTVENQTSEDENWIYPPNGTWTQTWTQDPDTGKYTLRWEYEFDVYDAELTYYLWESTLPGYTSDADVDNPITLTYHPAVGDNPAYLTIDDDDHAGNLLGPDEDGNYAVKVTNTKTDNELGSLKVKKLVVGSETSRDFNIVVTLSDTTITGTYGDMVFINGVANITLHHGQTLSASNLPMEDEDGNAITFTVTETTPAGYQTPVISPSGAQPLGTGDDPTLVTVTNTPTTPPPPSPVYGGLSVTKTVEPYDTMTQELLDQQFQITVTLYSDEARTTVATDINGVYGSMNFTNGVYTFLIKHGQTVSASGIPLGYVGALVPLWFGVEETTPENFSVTIDPDHGQLTSGTVSEVSVTNTQGPPPETNGFTLKKIVSNGDTAPEFTFTVVFRDLTPLTTYTYVLKGQDTTFASNASGGATVSFKLKHDQTAVFSGLPIGSHYTVTESESGYIASFEITNTGTGGGDTIVTSSGANTLPNQSLATSQEEVESGEVITIIFTNTPDFIDINGEKTWEDNENAAGLRPNSINIYLYADDALLDSRTVTADDNWAWSFTDLPTHNTDGSVVDYTIEEDEIPYYTTTIEGYDVTNTYVPDVVNIVVEKEWIDTGDNRPGSISVKLFADGSLKEMVDIDASTNWSHTFSNLPKHKVVDNELVEIVYTIDEVQVSGYLPPVIPDPTVTISGNTTTYTYTITNEEYTDVDGSKTWNDLGLEELRPASITVQLMKSVDGGDPVAVEGKTKTVTADDNWEWSFTYLPTVELVGEEYLPITYSVQEIDVPGYETEVDGMDLVNTPETKDIKVIKVWDDDSDSADMRPDSISVKLFRKLGNGTPTLVGSAVTLSGTGDTWEYTWEDLPAYGLDATDNTVKEYTYSVDELTVENYAVDMGTLAYNQETGLWEVAITNSLNTGDLEISKVVDEGDQDTQFTVEITLVKGTTAVSGTFDTQVTRNGSTTNGTVTFNASGKETITVQGGTTYKILGLPAGATYTITEVDIPAGWSWTNGSAQNPLTGTITAGQTASVEIDNTFAPTGIPVPVKKIMTGPVPNNKTMTFTFTIEADEGNSTVTPVPMPANSSVTLTVTGNGTGPVNDYGSFGTISFNETGTYTYIISETVPTTGIPGVTYGSDTPGSSTVVTSHTLVVTVSADSDNALSASCTLDGQPFDPTQQSVFVVFNNSYLPAPTDVTIPVKKILNGPVPNNTTMQFDFELAGSGSAPMPEGNGSEVSITVTGNGTGPVNNTGSFGQIDFDAAGEYTYTITETVPEDSDKIPGVTYTTTTHTLVVTVTDNNGQLEYTCTLDGDPFDPTDESVFVEFTNTYSPGSTTIPVPVKKIMTGPVPNNKTMTFNFTISSSTGTPMPENTSIDITVTGNGTGPVNATGNFGDITYEATGTYTYTISETVPASNSNKIPGVTYGSATPGSATVTTTHTLVVTVSDPGGGNLSASCTLDGQPFDPTQQSVFVVFNNSYQPAPTDVTIPVKKILNGPVPNNTTMQFDFELAGSGSAPMPEGNGNEVSITVTGNGTGPVNNTGSFGQIDFDAAGEYTYTITESVPEESDKIPGVTYTTTTHTLVVTVTDNNGQLEASCTLDGDPFDPTDDEVFVEFTNTYAPGSTSIPVPVKKIMEGPVPSGTSMTFGFGIVCNSAVGADGSTAITPKPMPTNSTVSITVTGDGTEEIYNTGTFGTISFTKAGTYTYVISESVPEDSDKIPGVTYTTETHTLVVTVSDAGGELSASCTLDGEPFDPTDEENPVYVEFTNTFEPVELTIPVKKILTGPLGSGQTLTFDFTLENSGDAPMPAEGGESVQLEIIGDGTDQVDATGSFGTITYNTTGEYTYIISETVPATGIPGVTYGGEDATVEHTLVVTVDTDDDNALTFSCTLDNEPFDPTAEGVFVVFNNTYEPPELNVSVEKIWDDEDDQDGIRPSSIELTLSATYVDDEDETHDIDLAELTGLPESTFTVTLTATGEDDTWTEDDLTYTWEDLPQYKDVVYEITYAVAEAAITYNGNPAPEGFTSGYTATVSDPEFDEETSTYSFEVTNTHVPETMDFEFTKMGQQPPLPEEGEVPDYEPLAGVVFGLYTDPLCEEGTEAMRPDGTTPITATSDEDGVVAFEDIRFTETVDDTTTPPTYTYSAATYYMKETSLGEHDPVYWDNTTVYQVVLTPASGEDPASYEITVYDDTGLDHTGELEETDGYVIYNDLVHYNIQVVKMDHDHQTIPVENAEFDLYKYVEPEETPGRGEPTRDDTDDGEQGSGSTNTEGPAFTDLPEVIKDDTVDPPTYSLDSASYTKLNTESLVTGSDGKLDLGDLLPGTYYLVETAAPLTYYRLTDPVEIVVTKNLITMRYNITTIDGDEFETIGVSSQVSVDEETLEQGQTDPITFQITDQEKYGYLRIEKNLPVYENSESATFTFNVEGEIDGEVVYSTVVSLTVTAGGNPAASETLNYVPAGATVTVTEINSGNHYEATVGTGTVVIKAEVTVEPEDTENIVVIGNTYIPIITGGHGLENVATNGENGWEFERITTPVLPDPMTPPPGGDTPGDGGGK